MNTQWLDAYAHLDSLLHRWEPRSKLIALVGLLFAFAAISDVRLVPVMLALSIALYAMSRLPLTFLLSRLRYPGALLLVFVGVLPFIAGEQVVLRVGLLALHHEGLLLALLTSARFAAILTTSLVLFGTTAFLTIVRTLAMLGVPALLVDMLFFFYRYLATIAENLSTMQRAMHLRGFRARRPDWRTITMLAALAGSLLIRSYEQSERVYQAMRLRGYGHTPPVRHQHQSRAHPHDRLLFGGTLACAGALVAANSLLLAL